MNKIRDKNFRVTNEAENFALDISETIDSLFEDGKERKFSMRDIFSLIVHRTFKYYYIYLYKKDIEML